jgi:hypothetical protein
VPLFPPQPVRRAVVSPRAKRRIKAVWIKCRPLLKRKDIVPSLKEFVEFEIGLSGR